MGCFFQDADSSWIGLGLVAVVAVVVVVVSDEIEMGWGVARTAACQLKTVLLPRVAFVLKWLEEMIEVVEVGFGLSTRGRALPKTRNTKKMITSVGEESLTRVMANETRKRNDRVIGGIE